MKLVVGLGNVGREFEGTHHNMGFMVIERAAKKLGLSFNKRSCSSLVAEGNVDGEKVVLAKPTTYMNASGVAVKALLRKFGVDQESSMLIISDDIDLPRGKVRVRKEGSAGTHNGLRSIVDALGSQAFPRLRIGVGAPPENMDLADYVLARAKKGPDLDEGLRLGEEACLEFIHGATLDNIMQKVN